MAWRLANSLQILLNQANVLYPGRSKLSDGTLGDAAHAAVASDHNPNRYGVVCALDLTHDPSKGFDAHAVANLLIAYRHPDLKYVISNGRIAGAWTNWNWTAYNGSNPHTKHIHVSVGVGNDGQSVPPYDSNNVWLITGGKGASAPEKDDMIPDENHLQAMFRAFRGRQAGGDEVRAYVGSSYSGMVESLDSGDERNATANALATGQTAIRDNWPGQISSLQAQLRASNDMFNTVQQKVLLNDKLQTEVNDLKAKNQACLDQQQTDEETGKSFFRAIAQFFRLSK